MNLLSLTYAEFERLLKGFALLTVALAIAFTFSRWHFFGTSLWSAAWQGSSTAFSATAVAFGFLARRTWDSPRLARWLRRPTVHGVWIGSLDTNFNADRGERLPPIQIVFVIKQTYLTLSIESFTRSQEGESKVEALVQNTKTNAITLWYLFELRRQYRGENKLTTGSGELRLLENPTRLRGHYWTNSPTQGHLDVQLVCRDCRGIDCFEVAEKKWMASQTA